MDGIVYSTKSAKSLHSFLSRTTACPTIIRITKVGRRGTRYLRPFPQCLYEKRGCWNCIINRFVQSVWSARGKKTHIVRRCFMESGNHMTRFYAKKSVLGHIHPYAGIYSVPQAAAVHCKHEDFPRFQQLREFQGWNRQHKTFLSTTSCSNYTWNQ